MTIQYLVTHSGGFHADELLSSVILTRLFPQATLVRSRDAAWTTPAEDRIIYDVGREYDADRNIYDHHQKPAPLREDEQPYSSFGLIWKHFGADYLRAMDVPDAHIDTLHAKIDKGVVLPIDLMDNGAMEPSVAGPLSGLTLPVLLETLKPAFDDPRPDADDNAFAEGLGVARSLVEAAVRGRAGKLRAYGMVVTAIEAAGENRVLELPMGMPFRSAVEDTGADHLLYCIHPRAEDWTLTGIRKGGDTFDLRADLPEAWAGLTDAALEDACGVKGAKFCHNGRFIAVASSREAIVEMAQLAVKDAEARAQD
ncbi:MYG1 family protein [Sagittula sp. SSi028]|uniref:MYG1 family protein n=1 Tax=Sagittula sp. SSi028 TaxID=3400636 RepID=UPI003AF411CF